MLDPEIVRPSIALLCLNIFETCDATTPFMSLFITFIFFQLIFDIFINFFLDPVIYVGLRFTLLS